MDGRYTVRVRDEASRLRITINEDPGDGLLHTSLDLARRRLTDRMVLRMLIRYPFVTHKTIGMIHWHALRLWLHGAPFYRHMRRHDEPVDDRRRLPHDRLPSLSRVAWRIAVSAAGRVTVGRLLVVLPDGERRTFGPAGAEPAAEIHIHDRRALVKLLVGGETGGGEAYMDAWSSPDLAGLLRWAALNRESLALSTGWFRRPAQVSDDRPVPAEHEGRAAATSRRTTTWATTSTGRSSTRP